MSELAALVPFAALGLAGALHCVGMCGGFAVAVAARARGRGARVSLDQAAYAVGKAASYATLGALAAGAGHAAVHATGGALEGPLASRSMETARAALAWVAGLSFVALGLSSLGLFHAPNGSRLWQRGAGWIRARFADAFAMGGTTGALGAGLLNGLLPCGLSWAALALAATLDPVHAMLGMFTFGLATTPALAATGFGWALVGARRRALAARLLGPLFLVFGVWTLARGGIPFIDGAPAALPPCCTSTSGQP